jgi:hypothetical protein
MILILALASCTSAAVDQVASNPAPVVAVPPISSFPRITDPSPDSLPIEAFLLSSRQEQELLTGQQRLIAQCMAKSGYAYNVPESANAAAAGPFLARRYGVVSHTEVAKFGYHPPSPAGPSSKAVQPVISSQEQLALTGGSAPLQVSPTPGASKQRQPHPGQKALPGGCVGASLRTLLAHGGLMGQPSVAEKINFDSFSASLANRQVVAAFSQWSKCMASDGFSYSNPMDAVADPRWQTAAPSRLEIRTAQADVACKATTNLVGTWFTVESAIQEVLIKRQAAALAAARAGIRSELVIAVAAGTRLR